jgi:hypothetical protein
MKTKLLFILFLAFAGNIFGQTELIQNGNFSGLYSNWSTTGSWYVSNAYSCYHSSTAYAYVGNGSGDGVNNAYGNLYQTITIPANATSATLSYYVSINTDETTTTTTYDYIAVYLTDLSWNPLTSTTSHTYGNLQGSYGSGGCQTYQSHSFSIPSSLFGQTVIVVFHTYTDNAKITKFRVDDVSLLATAPSCNPVSMSTQPQSQTVCNGNSATFNVACNGTSPYTYAWYNGSGPITGATTASYSTSTAGNYYCIIKNCSNNYQVTSSTATLTISASPVTPIIAAQASTSFCQGGSATLQVTNPSSGCTYSWSNGSTGTTILVNSAGTYTATANSSCGTSGPSNALIITVNPPPTTPVITAQGGITSFCQGGSTTLQVTNPASGCTYSWSNGNTGTSTSVSNAGTYNCTPSNSCGAGSPSNSIPVTANLPPSVAFSQLGYACMNYFTDNSSGSPISWNWNFGDPASSGNTSTSQNPEHSFSDNGTYNVTLQAANICGNNTASQYITVTNCESSGINANNLAGNEYFSIYPNPIENSAVINFTMTLAGKASVKLYDVLGKQICTIIESDFNTGDYSIIFARLEGISLGTYFVRFVSNEYSQTLQVVFL